MGNSNGVKAVSFPFPAVTFGEKTRGIIYATFNKAAADCFAGVERLTLMKTSELIIFATKNLNGCGETKLRRSEKDAPKIYSKTFVNYPLEGNTYKLYRCTHGWAIKIYEPIYERRKDDGKSI